MVIDFLLRTFWFKNVIEIEWEFLLLGQWIQILLIFTKNCFIFLYCKWGTLILSKKKLVLLEWSKSTYNLNILSVRHYIKLNLLFLYVVLFLKMFAKLRIRCKGNIAFGTYVDSLRLINSLFLIFFLFFVFGLWEIFIIKNYVFLLWNFLLLNLYIFLLISRLL